MSDQCPRCGFPIDPLKDIQKIDDYDVNLVRCSECLNEYVE
jgi:hypothetical protein